MGTEKTKFITVRGKKMIEIPVEELHFVELKVGYIPKDFFGVPAGDEFFRTEFKRIMNILKHKYGADAEEQYSFRRYPSIFNGKYIPERHFQELHNKSKAIKKENFRDEQDILIKEICDKYKIKYFDGYK